MKNCNFLFAVALALVFSATSQAGSVHLGGNVGNIPAGTTNGSIQVLFDLDAQDTFANGGVVLGVEAGNPGVVRFDSAVVDGGAWTLNSATLNGDNRVDFSTSSVLTAGLTPAGGTGVQFATINYTVLGPGATSLQFVVGAEALVDGRNFGTDVTPNYTFEPNLITVAGTVVPEPATLALVGMGLIGLVLRRRNG